MSILSSLGVHGWRDVEDLVLSSLVSERNMVMLGEKGSGKTFCARRISEALAIAYRAKKKGAFQMTKLDGYASREEDFIGYTLVPTPEEVSKAYEEGKPIFMRFVYSPNTIAFSDMILIDELTRIRQEMQSNYLGLLQERFVDGVQLKVRYIWASANPVTYSATETLDEAMAGRWALIVKTPEFGDLPKSDRIRIIRMGTSGASAKPPTKAASLKLYDLIESARKARKQIIKDMDSEIADYVDSMIKTVNDSVKKRSGMRTTSPIDGRRADMIQDNIVSLHAIAVASKSSRTLAESALMAFEHSLPHELLGEEPIPQSVIHSAHDVYGPLLSSNEDRMIATIEAEGTPAHKVAKAFEIGAPRSMRSRYVAQAYNELKSKGDIGSKAFAWTMLRALNRSNYGNAAIDMHAIDPLVAEVHEDISRFEKADLDIPSIKYADPHLDATLALIKVYEEHMGTPEGRAAIAIATGIPSENRSALTPTTQASERHLEIKTNIQIARSTIDNLIDVLDSVANFKGDVVRI